MPTTIVFSTGPSGKTERMKVSDDPATVVEKLGASKTGFADFSYRGKTVWINRDQVRTVSEAREREPGESKAGGGE
jgi:hypothetical protein